ncbi:hypothetical protein MKW98_002726 [Papaver atlanticum]|uniref:Uncharacterized protein n=1 Tax=Papaver atlanticum TaxID=357466 RepID=A0AAD4XCL8_9MAGN|nr:hypothetical protein MKW98_002726 [Papaver atlanticum]
MTLFPFWSVFRLTLAAITPVLYVANRWGIWQSTLGCLTPYWLLKGFLKSTEIVVRIFCAMTARKKEIRDSTGCIINAGFVVHTTSE